MCGRYYVDDETARAMEALLRGLQGKIRRGSMAAVGRMAAGDVHPSEAAPVLWGEGGAVRCGWQRWGFPGFQGKRVIFNARSESAMEKPLFRDSIMHRRIAVPAAGFYEWNSRREKSRFYKKGCPLLLMAGCSRQYEDGAHFVILTTAANGSMKPVHERMPLILEWDEAAKWVLDDAGVKEILGKIPCLLERESDYEQLSLF